MQVFLSLSVFLDIEMYTYTLKMHTISILYIPKIHKLIL